MSNPAQPHACEALDCTTPDVGVKYDRDLRTCICHFCWADTPRPKPRGKRAERED